MGHKLNTSNYSTHTPTMTHTRRSELGGREEEEKKTAHKGLAGSGLLQGNDRSSPACVCEGKRERERESGRGRGGERDDDRVAGVGQSKGWIPQLPSLWIHGCICSFQANWPDLWHQESRRGQLVSPGTPQTEAPGGGRDGTVRGLQRAGLGGCAGAG